MYEFNLDEIDKLKKLLNLILPKSNSDMPEAYIILENLNLNNKVDSNFIQNCKILCSSINQVESQEDIDFIKKNNFRNFSNFVNSALILFYSNKEVLKNLKVGSSPPFPEGNYVKEGDIYLLEQVFLKDKIYKQ